MHNFSKLIKKSPQDELGTPTEAELHLKSLLDKQLNTKISLKSQLQNPKEFTPGGAFSEIPASFYGIHTLPELQLSEENEEMLLRFKRAGLTQREIELHLNRKSHTEPSILNVQLGLIQSKLVKFDSVECNESVPSGSKSLGRHEMDLERSLYHGCANRDHLKSLVHLAEPSSGPNARTNKINDPFEYVGRLAKLIDKEKGKKIKKNPILDPKVDIQPILDEAVMQCAVPLDLQDILENRCDMEEIKDKFKDYEPGVPNHVLYLKNLHPKCDIRELVALFGRFDTPDSPVKYRLLTGKMKGQAFVTLSDNETAEAALKLIHGYRLRNRPMIIQYGNKKK